jgi:hypothetical protein
LATGYWQYFGKEKNFPPVETARGQKPEAKSQQQLNN